MSGSGEQNALPSGRTATRTNVDTHNTRGPVPSNPSYANSPAGSENRTNQPSLGSRSTRDFGAFRQNLTASRHFHAGGYNPPHGYSAHRWTYGERLPRDYFAQNYWLLNFGLFGLFAPPDGLVWVRVGDDALLIDEYTGEIIQVDYGVFY